MFRRGYRLIALGAAATLLAGCASLPSTTITGEPETNAAAGLRGELTIFAAASLGGSFTELAEKFVAANPAVTVKPIAFDGSSTLATQIVEGAPVDVFASADLSNMRKIADQLDGSPTVFATNTLQIAVAPGNPLAITTLADLARADLQVVLCAPAVPCGAASQRILQLDGVSITPVSEEQNVTAVLRKVQAGEADAGLVYVTDVLAAMGAVDGVSLADPERAANAYPIATLKDSRNAPVARAFVNFVLSAQGLAILADYGFGAP